MARLDPKTLDRIAGRSIQRVEGNAHHLFGLSEAGYNDQDLEILVRDDPR